MQPLLQWKSNKYHIFWVCVCSLIYPACSAHAPVKLSFVECLAPQHFCTLCHKRHDFGGKKFLGAENVCLDFLYKFRLNISHSGKSLARYYHKCSYVFMWCIRYSSQVLIKLVTTLQMSEKYSNFKFHFLTSHRAFFNSLNVKHQPVHFTFNNILV